MSDLLQSSASEMARAVREREISAVELVDAHIARIEQLNPEINAVILPRFDEARSEAKAAERAIAQGEDVGPLHGVPYTAKEPIEVAGMPVCDASKLFEGTVSSDNAIVVDNLDRAGAILLGKTNIPEFALHYDSNNSIYGATANPHDTARTAGGSSGGEAAALVTGMSAFGVGSDYGGSIRVPASYCGALGLKPGRFVVPYAGHFPPTRPISIHMWSVVGPMARYVEDLELLLPIFATPDQARDPDYCGRSFEPRSAAGLTVAAFWEDGILPVEPPIAAAVRSAADALRECGHEVVEARPPMQAEARDAFIGAALAETAALLAPLADGRRDELSPQTQHIFDTLLPHADATVAGYGGRLMFELALEQQVAAWQVNHPLAIAPITPNTAFPLGATTVAVNGEEIGMIDQMAFATYVNQLGLPAAAVPVARSAEGMPIGVQVIGRRDRELEVLAVARELEQAFGGWMAPASLTASAS